MLEIDTTTTMGDGSDFSVWRYDDPGWTQVGHTLHAESSWSETDTEVMIKLGEAIPANAVDERYWVYTCGGTHPSPPPCPRARVLRINTQGTFSRQSMTYGQATSQSFDVGDPDAVWAYFLSFQQGTPDGGGAFLRRSNAMVTLEGVVFPGTEDISYLQPANQYRRHVFFGIATGLSSYTFGVHHRATLRGVPQPQSVVGNVQTMLMLLPGALNDDNLFIGDPQGRQTVPPNMSDTLTTVVDAPVAATTAITIEAGFQVSNAGALSTALFRRDGLEQRRSLVDGLDDEGGISSFQHVGLAPLQGQLELEHQGGTGGASRAGFVRGVLYDHLFEHILVEEDLDGDFQVTSASGTLEAASLVVPNAGGRRDHVFLGSITARTPSGLGEATASFETETGVNRIASPMRTNGDFDTGFLAFYGGRDADPHQVSFQISYVGSNISLFREANLVSIRYLEPPVLLGPLESNPGLVDAGN